MRANFNYFTAGTCVRLIEGEIKILIVHYHDVSDHKNVHEIRLPGGTVQFVDILNVINEFIPVFSPNKYSWAIEEIIKITESFEAERLKMPSSSDFEKKEIRTKFVDALDGISEVVDYLLLSDKQIEKIQCAAHEKTLRRELQEECAITFISNVIECGYSLRGKHTQHQILVLGDDAPDFYKGKDADIESSEFMLLSELVTKLYANHSIFLRNTLSGLIEHIKDDPSMQIYVKKIKDYYPD